MIVVGTVSERGPEQLAGRSFYRDSNLEVERYITVALPYDALVIRDFTGALNSAGSRMLVKWANLEQGQRVLLFLDKDWDEPPLADDEFTTVHLWELFGGKFWIRDGKLNIRYFDESEEYAAKDLEDVLSRIADIVDACA